MNTRCEPVCFGDEPKKIILGDALTKLKKLPSKSVELTFVDFPCSIGKNFGGVVESWDEEVFLAWLSEYIDECHRILKLHDIMCIMNSTGNVPYIDLKCRPLFTTRSRIMWSCDSSGVQAKNYFGSMYESVPMTIKDRKNYTFNRNGILVETKTGAKRVLADYRKNPPQPCNQKGMPGNVWEFPRVCHLMDKYKNHPTQEPKALLEHIILTSSNPDDEVLDPFAGSFTTGATAVESGRKFVGTEINTEHVKMGLKKLSIGSHLSETGSAKVKRRKIKNLSKRSRLTAKSGGLPIKQRHCKSASQLKNFVYILCILGHEYTGPRDDSQVLVVGCFRSLRFSFRCAAYPTGRVNDNRTR